MHMVNCSAAAIETTILEKLADVRHTDVVQVREEWAIEGDLYITAMDVCAVIAKLEMEWESDPLLTPKDFMTKKKAGACLVPFDGMSISGLRDRLQQKLEDILHPHGQLVLTGATLEFAPVEE